MITTDNYEGYLMRYADGALDRDAANEVEHFLDAHPELREELDAISSPMLKVTAPAVTIPGKERLLRPTTYSPSRLFILSHAAAVATLLIVATVAARHITGSHHLAPTTATSDTISMPRSTVDSIPPDSLYANPGRREPVYLAQSTPHKDTVSPPETEAIADVLDIQEPSDSIPNPIPIETSVEPTTPQLARDTRYGQRPRLVGGRCIVVEDAQLTQVVPSMRGTTDNPSVIIGHTVESPLLAENGDDGLINKLLSAIASLLGHNQPSVEPLLASSGVEN